MNFLEFLESNNVHTVTVGQDKHARVGWTNFACPFCGSSSGKFHMGYRHGTNWTSCWKCGSHSVTEVIVQLTGVSFRQAKKLVDSTASIGFDSAIDKRGKLVVPKGVREMSENHRRYLRRRGFDDLELEKLWKLQGISLSSRLAWRIFIPIIYGGKTVSWTTRSVSDSAGVRYISAAPEEEAMNHKHLLFGEDLVRHAAIIVEGPFDAMRIGPGAVGTLGTSYSTAQLNRMAKFPVRVICFDSEDTAQKRARALAQELEVFSGSTFVVELDAKDAGSASAREIKRLRSAFKLDS